MKLAMRARAKALPPWQPHHERAFAKSRADSLPTIDGERRSFISSLALTTRICDGAKIIEVAVSSATSTTT